VLVTSGGEFVGLQTRRAPSWCGRLHKLIHLPLHAGSDRELLRYAKTGSERRASPCRESDRALPGHRALNPRERTVAKGAVR
jgi:hypothetical protein